MGSQQVTMPDVTLAKEHYIVLGKIRPGTGGKGCEYGKVANTGVGAEGQHLQYPQPPPPSRATTYFKLPRLCQNCIKLIGVYEVMYRQTEGQITRCRGTKHLHKSANRPQ